MGVKWCVVNVHSYAIEGLEPSPWVGLPMNGLQSWPVIGESLITPEVELTNIIDSTAVESMMNPFWAEFKTRVG